jgi:hypothetical protein
MMVSTRSGLDFNSANLNLGIEQVGQILYSLDLLDLSTLKSIVDSRGVTWYRPEVEIKIRLDDESGLLAFSVWHSGKEVGTAHIEIASS